MTYECTCDRCGETFESEEELMKHLKEQGLTT
jgi:hypothetical protein